MDKELRRKRRMKKTRCRIRELQMTRLSVYRTPQHIYAQIICQNEVSSRTLTQASTLDKEIRVKLSGDKKEKAKFVGKILGERAIALGIKKIAFDRSGYRYHGRIKALADGAREAGLEF